jgi:hypothetical protein
MRMLSLIVLSVAAWTMAPAAPSPTTPLPSPPAATTLERFGLLTNTVVIRGYTDVAGIRDEQGAVARVLAVEFTAVASREKASGIAIEIHPNRADAPVITALVDEDEIEGLIDAVDALAKIEHATTPLANYEARFRTRGGLELANIDDNGTRRLTLSATQVLAVNGQLVWATMSLPLPRAKELASQFALARDALTRARPATAPASDHP